MNATQQFKIETPIGSVESDSGNHMIDIGTVIIVIGFFVILKQIVRKYIK
tara:strand:+ start:669 stop:818 length:150 start_codon:yes stop_codon:yes gene_type:complete